MSRICRRAGSSLHGVCCPSWPISRPSSLRDSQSRKDLCWLSTTISRSFSAATHLVRREERMLTYIRLLDAAAEDADWREVAKDRAAYRPGEGTGSRLPGMGDAPCPRPLDDHPRLSLSPRRRCSALRAAFFLAPGQNARRRLALLGSHSPGPNPHPDARQPSGFFIWRSRQSKYLPCSGLWSSFELVETLVPGPLLPVQLGGHR